MVGLGMAVDFAFAVSRTRALGDAAGSFLAARGIVFLSEGTLQVQDLGVTATGFLGILLIGHLLSHNPFRASADDSSSTRPMSEAFG
jgi:hypothetical protein